MKPATPVAPVVAERVHALLRALRDEVPIAPMAIVALGGCALSMLTATLAVRLHRDGFAAREVGMNAAAAGATALLIAPFIPAAAARFGTARLLASALALAALALAGFAVTRSYAAWLLLRGVEGGCATVLFVIGEYWITTAVADAWRGLVIGLYVAGVAAAFALGPLMLAVLDPLGPAPLLAGMGLFAGAALLLRAVARGVPTIEARRRAPLLRCFAGAPVLMLAAVLHGAVETAGLNLLPVLGGEAGTARGTLNASLFIFGAGTLQIPIGVLAGWIGRARMLLALAGVASLGAAALAVVGSGNPGVLSCGLVLWGGVVGSFYPVGLGELPARFDRDRLVAANSAFVLAYAVGTLIGPPLVGAAVDALPGCGFFIALAALNAAFFAAALTAVRRTA